MKCSRRLTLNKPNISTETKVNYNNTYFFWEIILVCSNLLIVCSSDFFQEKSMKSKRTHLISCKSTISA